VVAVPDSARGRLDARGRVGGRRGVTLLLVVAQAAAGDDEEEGDGSRCASTQAHAAIVPSAGSGTEQTLGEVAGDAVEADPLLGHRVALAHRDRVVLEGVEVDRHAVRGADLVLATVTAADRAGVVELEIGRAL